MDITKIDKNFAAATVNGKEVAYYDVTNAPFSLEGFPWGDPKKGEFYRLPPTLKAPDDINEGALWNGLHHASGGAVRFMTDSPFIAIRATLPNGADMNHMPRCGSCGFDIYMGPAGRMLHLASVQPCRDEVSLERMAVEFVDGKRGMRNLLVNLPLYGGVSKIEIGLAPDAQVLAPPPHSNKPILFYGSSITQGGCASRPGNNYCSMLCRALDAEQINLGFSGCGKGEPAVARAIASLDLGAFVLDYDHNAPDAAHLRATHETFFKIVREAHPNLPILMLSKCNIWRHEPLNEIDDTRDRLYAYDDERRAIIRATFEHAVAAGDKHVRFIDGEELFGVENRDECTVDRCHPNDLGFYRMFVRILPDLREMLGIRAN